MKVHPFTRPTIVAAIEFLAEMLTQAKFDQLVVRLELDNEIPLGTAKSVTAKSALLARIINQRATHVTSTLNGPMTLAEAAVREAVGATVPRHTKAIGGLTKVPRMKTPRSSCSNSFPMPLKNGFHSAKRVNFINYGIRPLKPLGQFRGP